MSTTADADALPYEEPSIVTILVLTSFLLLLNVVNYIVDRITYVGLLGQIFLGIAWGSPGGKFVGQDAETVIVNLGYLGLLLLVYEGGLATSFRSLKANLLLSSCVALTGIGVPIALSFILTVLAGATKLQAFAAGAALCSTSLGTTFTLLQTSGLNVTRLGVVLTSAAMMDDVVGLVMVQVISNLGGQSSSFSATTIVRPVFVSVGFGLGTVLGCRFVVLPATKWVYGRETNSLQKCILRLISTEALAFGIHIAILIAMVTGASYAGTSNLFAAYLAGAAISWWDDDVAHGSGSQTKSTSGSGTILQITNQEAEVPTGNTLNRQPIDGSSTASLPEDHSRNKLQDESKSPPSSPQVSSRTSYTTGITIFENYYHQPLQRILKPFFFASIGFSIPISRMFTGSIVWRGLVYTVLMFIGKVVCGLWLIRLPLPDSIAKAKPFKAATQDQPASGAPASTNEKDAPASDRPMANSSAKLHPAPRASHSIPKPAHPISLYPSAMLGCAMVARGEIGFLISSLAQSNSIFGEGDANPLFLIVIWAIMLCTILGPVIVGLTVKRLNKLDKGTGAEEKGKALGVWGIN